MFDNLGQRVETEPEDIEHGGKFSTDSGEDHSRWNHPLTIVALIAAILILFLFVLLVPNTRRDYSVKCYQQGTLIYSGTVSQDGLGYNSTETGGRVILPADSCIFTEVLK